MLKRRAAQLPKLARTLAAVGLSAALLGASACSPDTASALTNLAATTSGSLVQILVQSYLNNEYARANPDPNIPISDQIH